MPRFPKQCCIALTISAMVLAPAGAREQDMEVELPSDGGSNTYRLPDNVTQVDLARGICI